MRVEFVVPKNFDDFFHRCALDDHAASLTGKRLMVRRTNGFRSKPMWPDRLR
jgi:hypothetical protein